MSNFEIILIAICLSMDAFSVSISKGIYINNIKNMLLIAGSFGLFQGLMPLLGYYLGDILKLFILKLNILSSIILMIIGLLMIKDAFKNEIIDDNFDIKSIITLSLITSIDAFSAGISFSFLNINILKAIIFISIITFVLCFIGTYLGVTLKNKLGNKSKLFGGLILMLISLKEL